jgi:tetratricopeptide (TPR) repeat protein
VLVDVLAPGVFVPCVAGVFALVYARLKGSLARWRPAFRSRRIKWSITALAVVLLLVFFGRAPGAVLCEYVAQQSLAMGNYTSALDWLNRALVLNPVLDQVSDFHIARGNAWYYLSRDDENDDSRAYIAFVYQGQSNYLGAYDELLKVWHAHNEHVSPWIRDEMSITLERLSEYALRNTRLAPVIRYNPSALPWLQLLGQIDASNVYSQYVSGRIYYAQNSYDACIGHM